MIKLEIKKIVGSDHHLVNRHRFDVPVTIEPKSNCVEIVYLGGNDSLKINLEEGEYVVIKNW